MMSDVADDMWDQAQLWADAGEFCEYHKEWYLPPEPCLGCEDGEEPMAEYKAVVDFAIWPNEKRQGNQPHQRSGKIEVSNALLREMVDAKKRGENVILQVAAWENSSRDVPGLKYLGCKLSMNGWLMNHEAKKKEDADIDGTYEPEEEAEEEENNEVGGDDLFT